MPSFQCMVFERSSSGLATEMPSGLSSAAQPRNPREFIGRVDQGLRRDAADIEAGSAWLLRLDDHCVDAKLPCPDRTDIAARACTDHQKLAGDVFHGLSLR